MQANQNFKLIHFRGARLWLEATRLTPLQWSA